MLTAALIEKENESFDHLSEKQSLPMPGEQLVWGDAMPTSFDQLAKCETVSGPFGGYLTCPRYDAFSPMCAGFLGCDKQMFGADEQVSRRGQSD